MKPVDLNDPEIQAMMALHRMMQAHPDPVALNEVHQAMLHSPFCVKYTEAVWAMLQAGEVYHGYNPNGGNGDETN